MDTASNVNLMRRDFLRRVAAAPLLPLLVACTPDELDGRGRERAQNPGNQEFRTLEKSDEEWARILEPDAYQVLFEDETERPFSSPLNEIEERGTFICRACYLPLFSSENKYMSGTGWPSFTMPIEGRVETKRDFALIIPRTEYHCARCSGHQGHVFDDGPPPRGERWCNNGLALLFVPEGETLPDLRS